VYSTELLIVNDHISPIAVSVWNHYTSLFVDIVPNP